MLLTSKGHRPASCTVIQDSLGFWIQNQFDGREILKLVLKMGLKERNTNFRFEHFVNGEQPSIQVK